MNSQSKFESSNMFSLILKYSIPAALSLLISAIYNIVDRIFVGNFNGTSALAGLSICFPLTYMMMAFGITCSAGGSSLFSLFSGKKEQENMNITFSNSIILVIFFEIILTIFLYFTVEPMLKLFGVTETAYIYAYEYYKIVIIGCIFQGLSMVLCDFIRVSGKPLEGMIVTGVGAITNIILDAVFVAILSLGVKGAAWATVIGQCFSVILGIYFLSKGHISVNISKSNFKFNFDISKKIIVCGFAFWISQMAMGLISLIYNSQLGKYGGDIAISVYAVIASVMTFVIMPASGISQGIQPIIGNNYGAGNLKQVMNVFYQSSALSVGVTCIIWIIVMVFPKTILMAFGAKEEMLNIGIIGLRINFCVTPILGFVMLVTTFFQSIVKPIPSIVLTFLRQIVLLITFIYVLPMFWDINGIFIAQPISDIFALIIGIVLIRKEHKYCMEKNKFN